MNVSVLKAIGETLVTIHGQHDNQILMAPERHIEILDSYAESEALIEDYHSSFRELQSIAKKINKIKQSLTSLKMLLQSLRLFIWQNNFFRAMMTQMVQWR